jgi:hypothetical protein
MKTFGCDCEFILTQNGRYKSAVEVLKGSRTAPSVGVGGHKTFYDNVLAEVAIIHADSVDGAVQNAKQAISQLKAKVEPCSLNLWASADYPACELRSRESREVGCIEEINAYTHQTITPPVHAIKHNAFRTAGGHIHLGGSSCLTDPIKSRLVVYSLDLFVGIPSLFYDNNEFSLERRKLYGKAGSFRDKPYGIEYRVLGPFWVRSPKNMSLFYKLAEHAVNFVEDGSIDRFWSVNRDAVMAGKPGSFRCTGYDKNLVVKAINSCDISVAKKLMILVDEFLPDALREELADDVQEGTNFPMAWEL